MPVYEYQCEKCGHTFDAMQSMSDEPLTECVECGGPVYRVLFAPAIHFKGSGFHNTDYGTKTRPKDGDRSSSSTAASSSDGGSTSGSSSDGSSTSTAATTKEATPKDRAARGTGP